MTPYMIRNCRCFRLWTVIGNFIFTMQIWYYWLFIVEKQSNLYIYLFIGDRETCICHRSYTHKWAATWQNQQNECAPSEDSDQPGHAPSLISLRKKKAWVLSYPLSAQRRLWSDWADTGRRVILLVLSQGGSYMYENWSCSWYHTKTHIGLSL